MDEKETLRKGKVNLLKSHGCPRAVPTAHFATLRRSTFNVHLRMNALALPLYLPVYCTYCTATAFDVRSTASTRLRSLRWPAHVVDTFSSIEALSAGCMRTRLLKQTSTCAVRCVIMLSSLLIPVGARFFTWLFADPWQSRLASRHF